MDNLCKISKQPFRIAALYVEIFFMTNYVIDIILHDWISFSVDDGTLNTALELSTLMRDKWLSLSHVHPISCLFYHNISSLSRRLDPCMDVLEKRTYHRCHMLCSICKISL